MVYDCILELKVKKNTSWLKKNTVHFSSKSQSSWSGCWSSSAPCFLLAHHLALAQIVELSLAVCLLASGQMCFFQANKAEVTHITSTHHPLTRAYFSWPHLARNVVWAGQPVPRSANFRKQLVVCVFFMMKLFFNNYVFKGYSEIAKLPFLSGKRLKIPSALSFILVFPVSEWGPIIITTPFLRYINILKW